PVLVLYTVCSMSVSPTDPAACFALIIERLLDVIGQSEPDGEAARPPALLPGARPREAPGPCGRADPRRHAAQIARAQRRGVVARGINPCRCATSAASFPVLLKGLAAPGTFGRPARGGVVRSSGGAALA